MGPALQKLLARSSDSASASASAVTSAPIFPSQLGWFSKCRSYSTSILPHRLTIGPSECQTSRLLVSRSSAHRHSPLARGPCTSTSLRRCTSRNAQAPQSPALPIATTSTNGKHLALLLSLYTGAPLFRKITDAADPFARLLFEADVRPCSKDANRLVDNPEHAQNMELWLELLRFRKRVHGHAGVKDIWTGMMHRNLQLPVVGPIADALWTNFIACAIIDPAFLEDVCLYLANTNGNAPPRRPYFYSDAVGTALRHSPHLAIHCHDRLQHHQLVPDQAAASVFAHALHSRQPELAVEPFAHIYLNTSASAMYDSSMSSVYESCGFVSALTWHRFFMQRDDSPSPSMMERPIVAHLLQFTDAEDRTCPVFAYARARYDALQSQPPVNLNEPLLSRASMNTLVGNVHDIRRKAIGDAFCARLFATSAFSIETVIAGLRLLGHESIGSVALREIAVRAEQPVVYLESVRALQKSGIAIQDSTFSRILMKFAKEENSPYFSVIIESDQHPESYDDEDLQWKLFSSFSARGEMLKAHVTLAVLAMFSTNPETFILDTWLKEHSKNRHAGQVFRTLEEMYDKGIPVSRNSLSIVVRSFIGYRRRAGRPMEITGQGHTHNLQLVSNMLLTMLRRNQRFDPSIWREIMKRFGKTYDLQGLERLSLWIVACYTPSFSHSALTTQDRPRCTPAVDGHVTLANNFLAGELGSSLKSCFPVKFVRGIIAWGFLNPAHPMRNGMESRIPFGRLGHERVVLSSGKQPHIVPERWAWGIALARRLRDSGVLLNELTVRKEIMLRLRHIFGYRRSSSHMNRRLRATNITPLLAYVKHAEEVWGKPLSLARRRRVPTTQRERLANMPRVVDRSEV